MTKPNTTKRPNGAIVALAAGLKVTTGYCHKLIKGGMPPTLREAKAWRENHLHGDDSAQSLRRERIALVREQKTKCRIDNEIRLRAVIPEGVVKEGILRIVGGLKGALYKLTNDIPPRLAGLDESGIQEVLRDEIDKLLTRMSTDLNAM